MFNNFLRAAAARIGDTAGSSGSSTPALLRRTRAGIAAYVRDYARSIGGDRWAFFTIAAVLLPTMILASFDFGVTWDEKDRHRNGELVWQFIRGVRSRSQFAETGGHLYPGLFDTICAALETWIPANRYVLRHAVNATFGWIGVVYCGRLAGRLFGPWSGVLALALLALSPRYFADAMNNPKDLPFAAVTVAALYYISMASSRWPYVSLSTGTKIAVAIALALNIRVGALLYLGYFGLLVGAFFIAEAWRRREFSGSGLANVGIRVVLVVLATLVLGTIFWPWAGGAPLTRPFIALLGAANYPWDGQVLFRGVEYSATELPWYYAPWWLLISTPPVVIAGVVLSCVVSDRQDALRRAGLWVVVLLPLVAGIIMRSTLYDGIRHLLFIYPPLVVIAASGWTAVMQAPRPRWLRRAAASGLAIGLATVLAFDLRYHPNQGVYFNGMVGGPRGAFQLYDMDYWGNCVLQGVEWSAQMARTYGTVITISGNPEHLVQLNAERYREVYFTYPRRGKHYLHVRLARGPADALRQIAAEPALYQVRTPDGVVLCTVTPGPAFRELQAPRGHVASPHDASRQSKPE